MKDLRLPMGFSEVVILRRTDNTIVKRKGTKYKYKNTKIKKQRQKSK
jgi:hypothetical protein